MEQNPKFSVQNNEHISKICFFPTMGAPQLQKYTLN